MAAALGSTGLGQTNSGVSTVTSSSLSLTADSIIIVSCVWDTATFNTISTTKASTTLSLLGSQVTFSSGFSGYGRVYIANTTSTGSGTFTYTTSTSTSLTISAIEVTGADTTSGIDTYVSGTIDTSTPFTGATITPSAGERLLVAVFFSDQGGTVSVGSPWTKITGASVAGDADSWGVDAAYYAVTADGSTSYTPSFSGGSATSGIVVILSLTPAVIGVTPTITVHPANNKTFSGFTIPFSVTASVASGPISYQWQIYKSSTWNDISGATSSSYVTPKLTISANNDDAYRVNVTGTGASTLSNNAYATVYPPATFKQYSNNAFQAYEFIETGTGNNVRLFANSQSVTANIFIEEINATRMYANGAFVSSNFIEGL